MINESERNERESICDILLDSYKYITAHSVAASPLNSHSTQYHYLPPYAAYIILIIRS